MGWKSGQNHDPDFGFSIKSIARNVEIGNFWSALSSQAGLQGEDRAGLEQAHGHPPPEPLNPKDLCF